MTIRQTTTTLSLRMLCINWVRALLKETHGDISFLSLQSIAATFPIDPFAPIPSKNSSESTDNNGASASAATDKRPTAFPVEHTPQLIDVSLKASLFVWLKMI